MTRSDMVKGMQCTEYWIVDLVVSVRSIQLQCTDFVYRIFPGGYFLFEPLLWHGREGSRAEGYFVQFFVTFGDKERLIIR